MGDTGTRRIEYCIKYGISEYQEIRLNPDILVPDNLPTDILMS